MITFSEAQLVAWLSPVLWPFLRILALFTSAPVFSMRAIPVRTRIGLAFLIAVCAQGVLADQPVVALNSRAALGAVAQQVAVGLAIGFAVRLVFVAVELAGEVIGLQMGLNFASFFDPTSNAQVSAVARFFGNIAMLLDGRWVTPPLACGLLPGVGRAVALREGRLTETVVRLQDLPRVQAWAFVNSLRGWLAAELVP